MLTEPERAALQGHWQNFRTGLLLFVLAVLLILAGYRWQPLIQVPGLAVLAVALFLAFRAYLGILKYRLKSAFKINK